MNCRQLILLASLCVSAFAAEPQTIVQIDSEGNRRAVSDVNFNGPAVEWLFGSEKNDDLTDKSCLILTNGDLLFATLKVMKDEVLTVELAGTTIGVPLENIRSIRFSRDRLPVDWQVRTEVDADHFFLRNGDALTGQMLEWTEDGFTVETAAGETTIPVDSLSAVNLNPEFASPIKTGPQHWRVRLSSGSWLTANALFRREHETVLELPFGPKLLLSDAQIARVLRYGDDISPVTTAKPEDYSFQKYLTIARTLQIGRNVLGGMMMSGGIAESTGFGLHSGAELTLSIPDGVTHLIGESSLDDAAGTAGSFRMIVEAGDEELFRSDSIDSTSRPVRFHVEVAGRRQLQLRIDSAARGPIRDYANVTNLRFVLRK